LVAAFVVSRSCARHGRVAAPQGCRIHGALTIAKAFQVIGGPKAFLQGRIKVDGTFV
jgi:hypothetical protein